MTAAQISAVIETVRQTEMKRVRLAPMDETTRAVVLREIAGIANNVEHALVWACEEVTGKSS